MLERGNTYEMGKTANVTREFRTGFGEQHLVDWRRRGTPYRSETHSEEGDKKNTVEAEL